MLNANLFVALLLLCLARQGLSASCNPGSTCPSYPIPVPIDDISTNPLIIKALTAVDNYIQAYIEDQRLPGFVATVVYDQEIVWSKGYGSVNVWNGSTKVPDLDTTFPIASITKTFTGMMLYYLRDLGIVDLEDPITDFFPDFFINDPYQQGPLTLKQLISHSSGLPRNIPCNKAKASACSGEESMAFLKSMYLMFPAYWQPHYSNLGVALCGNALAVALNTSYDQFIQETFLNPMNMTSTAFNVTTEIRHNLAIATMYTPNGTAVQAPATNYPLGWASPAGGLLSSSRDIAKYISFMFSNGSEILPNLASFSEWFLTPVSLLNDGQYAYGYPWEFNYTSSIWLRSKKGIGNGFYSIVAMADLLKLGVFTCSFSPLDDFSGLTVPIMDILIPVFEEILWSLQPPPPPVDDISLYTGTYQLAKNLNFEVYESNNNLLGQATSLGEVVLGSQVNLTRYEFADHVFRVSLTNISGINCRELTDGVESELIYFNVENNETVSVWYTGALGPRIKSSVLSFDSDDVDWVSDHNGYAYI